MRQQRSETGRRRSCVAFTVGKLIVTRLSDTQEHSRTETLDTGSLDIILVRVGDRVWQGGPITAGADVPGGPVLAGDRRRRDRPIKNRELLPNLPKRERAGFS